MPTEQSKVIVLLNDAEHKLLKQLAAESRRTLGQELAFRALSELRRVAPGATVSRRRKPSTRSAA